MQGHTAGQGTSATAPPPDSGPPRATMTSPPAGGTRVLGKRRRTRPRRAGRMQAAGAHGPLCVGLRCAEACGPVAVWRSGEASRRAAHAVVGPTRPVCSTLASHPSLSPPLGPIPAPVPARLGHERSPCAGNPDRHLARRVQAVDWLQEPLDEPRRPPSDHQGAVTVIGVICCTPHGRGARDFSGPHPPWSPVECLTRPPRVARTGQRIPARRAAPSGGRFRRPGLLIDSWPLRPCDRAGPLGSRFTRDNWNYRAQKSRSVSTEREAARC